MKRIFPKALLAMGDLFDIAPRGKSEAGRRLADIRRQFSAERDYYALRGDFCNVGKDIRKAMVTYERPSA